MSGTKIDRPSTTSERNIPDDYATQGGKPPPKTNSQRANPKGPAPTTGQSQQTVVTQARPQAFGGKDPAAVMRAAMEQARALEQGHGTGPTREQQAKADWQIKKDAFDAAVNTNKPADARIAELEQQKAHLTVLYQSGQIGEGVLTWKELEFLKEKGTDAEKAAADWMMKNKADFWDSMGKRDTALDLNNVPNLNCEPIGRGLTREAFQAKFQELDGYIAQARSTKVPVPADPGPAPGTPTSSTNPSTSGTNSAGTGQAGGVTKTPDQANAEMYPNASQVPPFSSSATSGEGRMLDASAHLQNKLDAMEKDLAVAAASGNQAAMTAISAQIAKLQAGMTALMQMLKQRQEMESNMSKMFSEMASSAVRNMR